MIVTPRLYMIRLPFRPQTFIVYIVRLKLWYFSEGVDLYARQSDAQFRGAVPGGHHGLT